jgi:hypothetical protein
MVFSDELLNVTGVNLAVQEKAVQDVLDELLVGRGIDYFVSASGQVVIGRDLRVAEAVGVLRGTVRDANGEAMVGAHVVLKGTKQGGATDGDGRFTIAKVNPGTYTLEVSFVGYKSAARPVTVHEGETLTVEVVLHEAPYFIGGIEVVADVELMPKDSETKTRISAGQIEHMQASSLGDVLQLMPGVKSENPGLVSVQQANIRGTDKDAGGKNVGAFGTQVVVDNVPTSNNANMQIDAAPNATAGRGIDLRSIATENIESVEVIRGVPSARHGDLTSGLIRVHTKVGQVPNRLKFKYNPNTYEGNLSGGLDLGGTGLGYNVNLATSERDIRRPGDGYTRIAAQLSAATRPLGDDSWQLRNFLYLTRAFDELKEDPAYAARTAYYNRDVNVRYTLHSDYRFDETLQFAAVASASYTRQNSFKQEMVSRDNIVLSNLLSPGTTAGRFSFGSYLSQYWVKGDVWNLYADLSLEQRLYTGEIIHTVTGGVKGSYDVNRGPGRVYDPLFPPWVSPTVGDRPRSYDALPGMTNLSGYLEDRIAGTLGVPFTLQVGLRYEMFNPRRFHPGGIFKGEPLVESDQGSYLDPRVNLSVNLFEGTQIRLGYGKTAKAPPLALIYPNLRYFDIVDTVAIDPNDATKNFAILSTSVFDRSVSRLHGYRQTKYEASVDQQVGNLGFSLTGFVNETREGFSTITVPLVFRKRSWPDWPDQGRSIVKDTVMDKATVAGNTFWSDARGAEFTIRTKRLPVINTVFQFDASYTYYEGGDKDGIEYGGLRTDPLVGATLYPIHHVTTRFTKDLLLKYRFEIHLEALRMWVTLQLEQQLLEVDGYKGREDSLALGYFTKGGTTVWIPESERGSAVYKNLRKTPQDYELREEDRPNKWLLNLRVSKELWTGTEISFFVNNFFNSRPLYRLVRTDANTASYERRNPPIYFGLECSSVLDAFFSRSR